MLTASAFNVIAGLWLVIAPWVLNYHGGDPLWNDMVFGTIVALLGFTKISGNLRDRGLSHINAAVGVWLFIAAFALDATRQAFWNDLVLGVIVFVLALVSASASEDGAAETRIRR